MDSSTLTDGLHALEIAPSKRSIEIIERLVNEIALWRVRGFVGDDAQDIVCRHVLDCAAGLIYISGTDAVEIADLGSGAGFPGIVLAAFLPDRHFTLIEASSNRAAFLNNVRALAKLENVSVVNEQMERTTERFDLITWRAFRQLPDIEHELLSLLSPDGHIAAYKGKKGAIESELAGSKIPWSHIDILPLDVPFLDSERNLLILIP